MSNPIVSEEMTRDRVTKGTYRFQADSEMSHLSTTYVGKRAFIDPKTGDLMDTKRVRVTIEVIE